MISRVTAASSLFQLCCFLVSTITLYLTFLLRENHTKINLVVIFLFWLAAGSWKKAGEIFCYFAFLIAFSYYFTCSLFPLLKFRSPATTFCHEIERAEQKLAFSENCSRICLKVKTFPKSIMYCQYRSKYQMVLFSYTIISTTYPQNNLPNAHKDDNICKNGALQA